MLTYEMHEVLSWETIVESLLDDDFVQINGAVEDGYAAATHLVRCLRCYCTGAQSLSSLCMATHLRPLKKKSCLKRMTQRSLPYV
jgi:hypothetical protein